jgi:hypothetical protein
MIVGGLVGTAYFFLFYDTSVFVPPDEVFGHPVGGHRVVNLDRLAQRQIGIIACVGLAIVDAILLLADSLSGCKKQADSEKP